MTRRDTPPYRADHVGSLLRPPELHQARADHAAGRSTAEQLRDAENDAIRDVVRFQEDVGLQGATDGEFRRAEWHTDFIVRINGLQQGDVTADVVARAEDGRELHYAAREFQVTSKIGLPETIYGDDFTFLSSCVSTAIPKQTLPSPSMAHLRANLSASPYTDVESYRQDVAAVYADEIQRLAALGCTYLQLDDTVFAFLNDPLWRENSGLDPLHQHEINVRIFNEAVADRPSGLALTVHMCRGNYQSAWFSEGGYDFVAESVFSQLDVDGFFLEYDDERSGNFDPLRYIPDDKLVVLGLVTTKKPDLESKDDLKRRVEAASKFVDTDRLCLSGQCGFASTVEGNSLTVDEQRAKLDLIVETASEIWG